MALSKKHMPPKSYQLKEIRNSYFCVTTKNQALQECALLFFR